MYRNFENKSLDEQAEEITHDLIWQKRNFLFDFDSQDEDQRYDYVKECTGAGIFFTLMTAVDLKYINSQKLFKTIGPLRKFMVLNAMHTPFYVYFYFRINKGYMDLKKYMVKKYLILGDEILFKPTN